MSGSVDIPVVSKFDPKGVKQAQNAIQGFANSLVGIGATIAGAFAVGQVVNFAKEAFLAAEAVQTANNRLKAVAQATQVFGAQTDRMTDSLIKFAEANELRIATDAEVIKGVQAQLLSFKQLSKSAGEAGGSFERATMAAFDMAEVMGMDANSAALQLAKALEDPVRGLTALRRSGTIFTQEQQDLIKTLVESGNILEAQNIILTEVESQYGGAAEATANWSERLTLAFDNVKEALGATLTPAFEQFTQYLVNNVLPTIQAFFAEDFPKLLEAGGRIVDKLQPTFQRIGDALREAFNIDSEVGLLEGLLDKVASVAANPEFEEFIFRLADGFLKLLPSLIDLVPLLVELLAEVIPGLVDLLPDFIALVAQLLPIMVALVSFFAQFVKIGSETADAIPEWASAFKFLFAPIQTLIGYFQRLRDMIKDAYDWLTKFLQRDAKSFNGKISGTGPFGLGGRRAMGGPVTGGTGYLIGEKGPELFVPSQNGAIIPNSGLGGSTYNITVNAGVGSDPVRVGEYVVNAIRRYERASGPVFASA